jgi:hypothetical protein
LLLNTLFKGTFSPEDNENLMLEILADSEHLLSDLNYAEGAQQLGLMPALVDLVESNKMDANSNEGSKDAGKNDDPLLESSPDAELMSTPASVLSRRKITESAAWALGSMLQNNFPSQKEFTALYGDRFLKLQKELLQNDRDEDGFSVAFQQRPRLIYAFGALLRGGNPEVIDASDELLVRMSFT